MLENTDKAVADLLQTASKLTEAVSPKAIEAAGKVAMLEEQSGLIKADLWLGGGILLIVIGGAIISVIMKARKETERRFYDDDNMAAACVLLFFGLVMGILATAYSLDPLNNAAAHDPELALARKAITMIGQK